MLLYTQSQNAFMEINDFLLEMEQKLAEERSAKLRLENRILELEKHSSMMDCDYKQALQKLDELRRHKDQLTEEVSLGIKIHPWRNMKGKES